MTLSRAGAWGLPRVLVTGAAALVGAASPLRDEAVRKPMQAVERRPIAGSSLARSATATAARSGLEAVIGEGYGGGCMTSVAIGVCPSFRIGIGV